MHPLAHAWVKKVYDWSAMQEALVDGGAFSNNHAYVGVVSCVEARSSVPSNCRRDVYGSGNFATYALLTSVVHKNRMHGFAENCMPNRDRQ